MRVIHIMRDGSITEDISGKVVKVEDAGPVYQLLQKINREGSGKEVNEVEV